jgi:hypothetical protein
MTFHTSDNKKSYTLKHGLIVAALLGAAVMIGVHSQARLCSHAALDSFLVQVQQNGGSLVRCREGECEDVRTGAYFGRKPDGFYLIYPDGTMTAQELFEQRSILERLMQDEQRECGVNSR